ncbi:hypothetical protein B0H13DRAFT_2337654 [Mycena leptocephala]|nr:hypothetical protein B0H13DRAFT_2337654 [Mycena leptocephala]
MPAASRRGQAPPIQNEGVSQMIHHGCLSPETRMYHHTTLVRVGDTSSPHYTVHRYRAHVLPHAQHPQCLLPIPHYPVFTFSPATSNLRTIPPPLEASACYAPPKRRASPVPCATAAAAIFHRARPLVSSPRPATILRAVPCVI